MRSESSVSERTRGVLAYCVGGIWFGARVEEVAGLMQADRPAPLPRQRDPLTGIIAFRGTMVPTFEIANYLGLDARSGASSYALILARGADRFGVMIPEIPHLLPAKELREADLSAADPELQSMLQSVFESGELRIHCLNYWSIID
ncbi:MAG: chemotaxis protein CheW, partial [Candidatus Eiseniibacteriota bacterium]